MKVFKLFVAIAAVVTLSVGGISIPAYAQENAEYDLCVTGIELSEPSYASNDIVIVFVTVKNIGSKPIRAGKCKLNADSGVTLGGATTAFIELSTIIGPNEELVYQFNDAQITSKSLNVRLTATANSDKSVGESDFSNNLLTTRFSSQKDYVDLRPMSVSISPVDFKLGDKAEVFAEIINVGGKDTEEDIEATISEVNGAKNITECLYSGGLKSREMKKVKVAELTVDSQIIKGTLTLNPNDRINENNFKNNSISFEITSCDSGDYNWKNAWIYAGGFVPEGVSTKSGELFIRTDVGGIYKYDFKQKRYYNLTQSLDDNIAQAMSGIAIDENNTNNIFIASGGGTGESGKKDRTALLRTRDGGLTWQNVFAQVRYGGGEYPAKGVIAIDPNNSNIFYTTSPLDGLYMSDNAQDDVMYFKKVVLPGYSPKKTADDTINNMLQCIEFVKSSEEDGRSKTIYVSAYNSGVYKSDDFGGKFFHIEDSPPGIKQMKSDSQGRLYAVCNLGDKEGKVYVYSDGKWTVLLSSEYGFDCIDINDDGSKIIVSGGRQRQLYYSQNGGTTWINKLLNWQPEIISDENPWSTNNFFNHTGFIIFDKSDETNKRVYGGDWMGTFKCEDITENTTKWSKMTRGLEELCQNKILSPKGDNDLYCVGMDYGFIRSENAKNYEKTLPKFSYEMPALNNGSAVDYLKSNPNYVAVAGGPEWYLKGSGTAGYSTDGGLTLNDFITMPKKVNSDGTETEYNENFGGLAVAANVNDDGNPTVLAVPSSRKCLYRTTDNGVTWSEVNFDTGEVYSFAKTVFLCSDFYDKDVFYYYNRTTGDFYVSRDNGVTFNKTFKVPNCDSNKGVIRAFAQKSGWIAVASGYGGL